MDANNSEFSVASTLDATQYCALFGADEQFPGLAVGVGMSWPCVYANRDERCHMTARVPSEPITCSMLVIFAMLYLEGIRRVTY